MGFNLFSEVPIALHTLTNREVLNLKHTNLQTNNKTFQQFFDVRNERIEASFQLKLSGNVFRCNCENSDFVLWISKTRIKLDKPARNYTCQLENGTYTNTQKAAENFHEFYDDCFDWVKEMLIPKIENTWKMKMCIEDRDILAGIIRSDAISQSIHESKNIVFVISKSFTEKHGEILRFKEPSMKSTLDICSVLLSLQETSK
ncbi:TLR7 [Mytilus edulis]|uniref:TLR7 n=1 Tax=Mytilus edulis TaxID=6550 RepID=A0A8S3R6E4_MYTED|nr:TLR7 [Mytilus edulis]